MTIRPALFFCALGALVIAPLPAKAHPHVFAEARLDVMLSQDGKAVESLRHLWRFDDAFSSTVVVEFDKNGDNKLDDAELAAVRDTVYTSLGDYNYFQLVTANGKDVAMRAPDDFAAVIDNNQLIIMFEAKPKEALELSGTVNFGVYDSTFYTAIDFLEDEQMAVQTLPDQCSRKVVRPDPDEIIQQNQEALTQAFMDDPAGGDMTKIFATRLELTCPANG
ncbi:MAG: DUF1007 family protein [Rhizobiaceae bacterium]|nr:DUF1007 family protein [Rhizobiaceae bacterium]